MVKVKVKVKIGSWGPPTDVIKQYEEMVAKKLQIEKALNQAEENLKAINEFTKKIEEFNQKIDGAENDVSNIGKHVLLIDERLSEIEDDYNEDKPEIDENTFARHTHSNADVLNEFGENAEGKPTYKGETLGGIVERPTAESVASSMVGTLTIIELGNQTIVMTVSAESEDDYIAIPIDAEIKDVQFLYCDEYISIRELHKADSGIPYYYSMFKTHYSNTIGGIFVCSLSYGNNPYGNVIQSFVDYESSQAKIIYYTD